MSIEYVNVEIEGTTYKMMSTNNATKGEIMNIKKPMYNSEKYRLLNHLDGLFADNPRVSKVLKLRFGLDVGDYCEDCNSYKKSKFHSLEEVGKILEADDGTRVTRERVRQIEARGLRVLRGNLPKLEERDLMDFFTVAPQFMLAVGVIPTGVRNVLSKDTV
jgi:DNA-directed RNA polymerase sigma subunit (sigma70/sigma32)